MILFNVNFIKLDEKEKSKSVYLRVSIYVKQIFWCKLFDAYIYNVQLR